MSNHPMCKECVAKSVCSAKYGQPICIEVHSKIMEYGKKVANSDDVVAQNTTLTNTESDAIATIKELGRLHLGQNYYTLNHRLETIKQRAHIS